MLFRMGQKLKKTLALYALNDYNDARHKTYMVRSKTCMIITCKNNKIFSTF